MQHPRAPESQERGFNPQQMADMELRAVSDILSVAVKRNLLHGDYSQPKVGGLCRDFAILAVSRFRESGIPARLRVGFADYLLAGYWEDHWLCEWHDGRRWKRLDVEFSAIDDVSFDALDVPRKRFVTASEAWFLITDAPETASRFGVHSLGLNGEWFVAGSLFREIAALRKLELKPWDYYDFSANPGVSVELTKKSRAKTRQLAFRLKGTDINGKDEPQSITDWPKPKRVISFPQGEPVAIDLIGA
ncbi:transglutaminase-like domain-containing protein [Agrobacterium fabrum]|uniref:transglutaminase-like domain-containing protein n=1 Tax=Agrobacterium fabrum TaxID=1176649 RepID=UPI001FCEDD45|nr:transglutaminase-like domain-containing protein [Agrobacterium fabrum]